MKITTALLLIGALHVSAVSRSQTITLKAEGMPIKQVFEAIHEQTRFGIVYDEAKIDPNQRVTVSAKDVALEAFLREVLHARHLSYRIKERTIFVQRETEKPSKAEVASASPQKQISGRVTDESGQALAGVTVTVKGTSVTVITSRDGSYRISVPDGRMLLLFTIIGFEPIERQIGNLMTIDVSMKTSVSDLDEVVVIGYGEVKREDLTGSVARVNVTDLSKAPVASFAEALAGRVAGVQVAAMDGQPGQEMNIVIRGAGSLTQNTDPLYVIDGFPMEDFLASSLNPEEIESISVLKDASATAVYGARASNGVVMIQTKKGIEGRPVVSLNSSYGYQQVGKRMELMSPYEFVRYQAERTPTLAETRYFQNGRTLETYRDMEGIDWQEHLFQTKPTIINNLAIRGGNAQTKYAISGSIYNQGGIILNTGYTRYQGRISLDQVVSDKLSVGFNVNKSVQDAFGIQASTGSSTNPTNFLFYNTWGYRPVSGFEDLDLFEDDFDTENMSGNETRFNPIVTAENTDRNYATDDLSAIGYLNYSVLKDLKLRITGNLNTRKLLNDVFYNSRTPQGSPSNQFNARGVNGSSNYSERSTWSNENTLTYDKRLDGAHRINVLAGFSLLSMQVRGMGTAVQHLPNEELGLSGFDEGLPYASPATTSSHTLASLFGRVRYSFSSRYTVEAVIRSDGSSKFAPENKWSYFPSGSFTWNMTNESFLKAIPTISASKLRLSYGQTGNNRVSDFAYLSSLSFPLANTYSFNNATPATGMVPRNLGNYDLRWETTEQIDVGYDLGLWKNRVELTVDFYQRTNKDLLLNAQLPLTTGFQTAFRNIGKLRNRGLEFSLLTTNVKTTAFSWSSNFNISFNDNKILALTDDQESLFSFIPLVAQFNTSPLYVAQVDQLAAMFYGYIFDGVYQYEDFDSPSPDVYVLKKGVPDNGDAIVRPGDIKYRDLNNDGTVNAFDQTTIGRGLPLHVGGFANNFTYGGFDLNVFFQWSYGNDLYNANRLFLEGNTTVRPDLNQFASYIDRWTPDNPTNRNFRAGGQGPIGRHSSRTIEDGSYLRLKTVSLGYELPGFIINKARLSRLRVNLSAQNLLTWTNYSGMDPEVSVRNSVLTPGFDYSAYPQARTLVFGINATF